MRKKHLFTSFALITALSVQMLAPTMGQPAMAATKMRLNKTSASINVGKKVSLKVIGCKKSVSWKTSNKIVATVKKSGKNSAVVTGKNIGTAKVTAKVKGKKFTCTVKVSKKKYTGPAPTVQPSTVFQGWTPTTSNTTGSTSGGNTGATSDSNPTAAPGGVIDPSVSTTTPVAVTTDRKFKYRPIDTSRPAKLDAKFYLSDFVEGAENSQFIYVNVCNNMTEDILIEPEAYIQTDGVCYPALNFECQSDSKGMEYIEVVKGMEKDSESEESETAPKETEEPKEEIGDEGREEENTKEEPKKDNEQNEEENNWLGVWDLVTYDAYDYVSGYYDTHNDGYLWLPSNKDSIFIFYIRVANKRYMTVVNYDKDDAKFYEADSSDLLFEIEEGDNKTEATSTPKVTESPKATSAPEASNEPEETGEPKETTAPESTKTPETDVPAETGEPDVTKEPEDPWDVDVTPKPEETDGPSATPEPEETDGPHATPKPEEDSEKITLENVRVEMEQIPSDGSYVSMTIYNDTEEELVVKSGAYVTTDGVKYMAMQYADEKEEVSTILAGSSDYMTYRTVEYMTNVDDYELWDFPINEDSTFTFSFAIGGKEYQAVIDLADGKVTYSTID